jgi:SAM-dependent methyltransferase
MADVLGIDLSRASLAYAKGRAEHFGIRNLRLAQADLLGLAESGEGPFDIIESVGVLHHMADPFRGWEFLTGMLRPGGLMLTGLYSAVSRRTITALRNEPDFPGPGCTDGEARRYRTMLIARSDDMARSLTLSQDFYTLNEFRDLMLHEQERPIYLSEIEAFISQNGLIFRGFQLPPPVISHFLKSFPDDRWPGTLDNWARYEEKHPRCFDGMYNFWCEKAE